MANIKAQATGNWSSTATWSGGVLPGSGDTAYANGFTVTIDQNITVVGLSKASGSGITAGGQFRVSTGGITVTVTGGIDARTQNQTDSSNILDFQHSSGTVTVNADLTGGNAGSVRQAIAPTAGSGGSLAINGNVTGGTTSGSYAIGSASVAITVTITGNIAAGSVEAVTPSNWTALTVNGNVSGSGGVAAIIGSATTITVNGDITPGSSVNAITATGRLTTRGAVNSAWFPTAGNVRSGTVYGNTSQYTGTLAVPPTASVAAGVPVDNTTGTAALKLSDVLAGTGNQIAAVFP